MTSLIDTTYPYLKNDISIDELHDNYIISPEEIDFCTTYTKDGQTRLCFLILLKTFQYLGYFTKVKECPDKIVTFISKNNGIKYNKKYLDVYDNSTTRTNHVGFIRTYLNLNKFNKEVVENLAEDISREKNGIINIINTLISDVRALSLELPTFNRLKRIASSSRLKVNDEYVQYIYDNLNKQELARIENIFKRSNATTSKWDDLKWEPKHLSHNNVKALLEHYKWLVGLKIRASLFKKIPVNKMQYFYEDAMAMDLGEINRKTYNKRFAYAAIIVNKATSIIKDDMCDVFIQLMRDIENYAKVELLKYKASRTHQAEILIDKFQGVLLACKNKRKDHTKMKEIKRLLGSNVSLYLDMCSDFNIHKNNNHHALMIEQLNKKRKLLMELILELKLSSSTKDRSIIQAVNFMLKHKDVAYTDDHLEELNEIDLSWLRSGWREKVFPIASKSKIDKQIFELSVMLKIASELDARDLINKGADVFGDFNKNIISKAAKNKNYPKYAQETNLPLKENEIIENLKSMLRASCQELNLKIVDSDSLKFKNDRIVLKKIQKDSSAENIELVEQELNKRIKKINILDLITEMSKLLNVNRIFNLSSGVAPKSQEHLKHVIATLFCFGCNVGAVETASIIGGISRKQIGKINMHYITEESLNDCICELINLYNKFELPKYWGTGEHAGVDGTHWSTYSKNLFSSYHFRYRKQGGVAYYHVSDTYIALSSDFISCGAYEALYLLDGVLKNESSIQPDKIHGDTHAQSLAIFGLSHLLGISIMPRIRKINKLKMYKSSKNKEDCYENIENLFDGIINWDLIESHLDEMVRIAMSIKQGKITASSILNRICKKSNKNKLNLAFVELGKVIRTSFLMYYIGDYSFRKEISAATCKNEEFNEYAGWVSFASSTIKTNRRREQRKFIKYNHLVTNMVVFYNVHIMSSVLKEMINDGYPVTEAILKQLSPYRKTTINRLGLFTLLKKDLFSPKIKPMYELNNVA